MRFRKTVIFGALALLAGTLLLASRMGGEFLPKLGEGAIVGTTVRVAGVSVEEAVAVNDRIEKLLLAEFPNEITNIWTRLGSAEVATDPMGIELSDFFLALKPRRPMEEGPHPSRTGGGDAQALRQNPRPESRLQPAD